MLLISCSKKNGNDNSKVPGARSEERRENPVVEDSSGDADLERDIIVTAQSVEDYFNHPGELTIIRDSSDTVSTELCHDRLINTFLSGISFYTQENMKPKQAAIATIGSYYDLSTIQSRLHENSLISHPLCLSSEKTLTKSLGSSKVPDSHTIKLLNDFASTHNNYREKAIKGDKSAKAKLAVIWSRFSSCLSFIESLTTADSPASYRLADRYGPDDYTKPTGVKFYYDKWQPEPSRLNIGLYQFTPNRSNNIHTCLNDWNQRYVECKITDRTDSHLIKLVGSSLQRFNSFCGANKIVQTFSVQINTGRASSTHISNQGTQGLKPAKDRCVTPHFRAGLAYNHFGPLQNSTGKNLKSLMSCVMDDPF